MRSLPRVYLWAGAVAVLLVGVLALVGRSWHEIVGVVLVVVGLSVVLGAETSP